MSWRGFSLSTLWLGLLFGFTPHLADELLVEVQLLPSESRLPPSLDMQLQLRCQVTAHPEINSAHVGWQYNFQDDIASSQKYTLNKQPDSGTAEKVKVILTIHGVQESDLGNYTCEAKNSDGMFLSQTLTLSLDDNNKVESEVLVIPTTVAPSFTSPEQQADDDPPRAEGEPNRASCSKNILYPVVLMILLSSSLY